MLNVLIGALILIAGVINFLPVVGLLSRKRLEILYGIEITDPNTEILMRHRAVMFGLIGGFMIYSAISGDFWDWAIGGGLISMILFIVLALQTGGYTDPIRKIIKADIFAILCLLAAGGLQPG